uniref:homeodomain-interacting protein kinase 1-like n=1 Tax=Epinephelus lanceolatus TaxID=310571 RepID=UPI00144873DD|nr:homeodomain-interacting protein kinase 1-like [Epinephelus lanceolatus]
MTDSELNSSPCPSYDAFHLPSKYTFLKVLGEGSFGTVLKCWKKDTKETVAVKIPKSSECLNSEIAMLKKFKRLKLEQHNIIKFLCCFNTSHGRALVFEMLDMSMRDYMVKTNCAPMRLSDVSTIIQQLAKALKALKGIGVIHTDLKFDNIMLVDHRTRPFQVKLIDFGLAIKCSKAKQGKMLQNHYFRAPEIILGLPFSEAIDMWSLGIMMACFVHGQLLFLGRTEYELLQYINRILGQPADYLLNNGHKTKCYFTRTESNSWRLKTQEEYEPNNSRSPLSLLCNALDDLKHLHLDPNNSAEAVKRGQYIDLLKAMLKLDGTERISPTEVLTHPFIASGHHSSYSRTPIEKPRHRTTSINPDRHHPALSPQVHPSGVILVRPAAAKNVLQTEDEDSSISLEAEPKKKNCVRRFFSWMRKTFCCSITIKRI